MFKVKNLRKKSKDGWTYLETDFEVTDIENPFEEKTMWIAVEDKNADMLTDDVYDTFVLLPLYLGMYYHQDVHIEGEISPRLYHNIIHYIMTIFDNFSDYTQRINFTVDGVKIAKKGSVDLIGTGISCGVDSLTTIYDNFIKTADENFRINSLFLLNCGTHGDYENEETKKIWLDRAELNKKAADELGLPMYLVDSNFHAYTHKIGEIKIGYLAIYSCLLGLQKYIKRYYVASTLSYEEISRYIDIKRDVSIASYSESYLLHLISTERFELVIDGCQYKRTEKIERISDWNIAQKYLNVCVDPIENAHNCSCCSKCMRTEIVLDAMGKLDKFKQIFDIEKYHKENKLFKCKAKRDYNKDPFETEIVDYAKEHNYKMPSRLFIRTKVFIYRARRKLKTILKK